MSLLRPLLALAALALPARLAALDMVNVSVTNGLGQSIQYLYCSPADSNLWGPDLLGTSVLDAGGTLGWAMHHDGTDYALDFLAIAADGTRYEHRTSAIAAGRDFAVRISAGDGKGQATTTPLAFALRNETGREIAFLFVSPNDSAHYGCDILGTSTLSAGGQHVFAVPARSDESRFDVWAIDAEGRSYKFTATVPGGSQAFTLPIETSDLVQ